MVSTLLALASLAAWLYLLIFNGGFWRLTEHDRKFAPPGAVVPAGSHVVAIVPARDEAEVIATSVASLLRQDFPGRFDVVLVDDESADGTGDVARAKAAELGAAERLTVLRSDGPTDGWTGKIAAMHRGFTYVRGLEKQPDFVLFCDADIAFAPPTLARLVAGATARGAALSSLMVKLRCESPAEKWFIPAFVFFFQMLYPFRSVNDPESKVAGAAGGVMLVRPDALAEAGGLPAIRGALIDDCALGVLMKSQGPIWLGLTDDAFSLRPYPHLADIERMVTRSAYAQLHYSPLELAGAIFGMVVVYLAPPLLTFLGPSPAREIGLVTWLIMAQAYMPSLRFYGLSWARALALPAVAACYTWFTALSAWRHMRGRGGEWKGRYQAPA
ncbi:glycosyltransferase [Methylocystis parvus]|uniref:Glycosyltransferase n=1 Tax=Methylocystis parvus TaxID=134 RepID=A0A6B8M2C3_9HYPH|nr:glycosyltransferase [Methylocystis parvus]QGM97964.1 glycosyltransferase [Methylocystis parvus]WBK01722.1 glycosyltransferase [Methylocystis parvus OBBP]